MKLRNVGILAAAVAGLLMSAGGVMANTLQAIQVGAGTSGANFTYTYSLQITNNNGLNGTATGNESGLVVLDFPGVTSISLSKSGSDITNTSDWSTSSNAQGSGGLLLASSWASDIFTITGFDGNHTLTDSGTVTNVTLAYTGVAVSPVADQTNLIHFTVTSSVQLISTVLQSVSRNTASTGNVQNEIDTFPVAATVPVPAAAWMGLSTLAGLAALGITRRRRVA